MTKPAKVIDIELSAPLQPLRDMDGYQGLKALARLHGTPIGYVEVPLLDANLTAEDLKRIVLRRLAWPIIRHHLRDRIENPLPPDGISSEELLEAPHPVPDGPQPLITVAVCTRDRTENLRLCLDSLIKLDYRHLDLIVVDNAPTSNATMRLVESYHPQVRYVCEPRPGLDWARNRAILEARGDIIAYTDDDVVVDSGWVAALASTFEDPHVMAVTGLVAPYELETESQDIFERRGGFGRGFEPRYWRMDHESGERSLRYIGTGVYGTGANMAYRRTLFDRIGPFDPALDLGTVTNGGGDLEMFFRAIKEGYLLAYNPAALVYHRHRRKYADLRTQIANNGVGFYSFLVRSALAYPDMRGDAVVFGLWWFWRGNLRRMIGSMIGLSSSSMDLARGELWGSILGLRRYLSARRQAAKIAAHSDGATFLPPTSVPVEKSCAKRETVVGVRMVDLCQPLRGLSDVANYAEVRVFVNLDGRPIGQVDIANHHLPLSAARLREAIVDQIGLRLLKREPEFGPDTLMESTKAALRRRYLPIADGTKAGRANLPDEVPVSIVVATYDRPDDLRECLRRLTVQDSSRPVEIVVVDNNPASNLTPPVVAEFPEARLVNETRQGLGYARNKGFNSSRGKIVLTTDDDVLPPPDWLEKLLAPFLQSEVAVVTGNTLPFELASDAQRRFESYGGLGRGFEPKEADVEWFNSFRNQAVPTWELGATANAAFRASIFARPDIGLMDEALGPGTPTGVGEDTYLFYKVLKAGGTIAYEPSAYVWHRHRLEMHALRNQLYNYSKGHVAYHLTTLLRDRDKRVMKHLVLVLPRWRLRQLAGYFRRRLLRQSYYPLSFILLEISGNIAGPGSLWQSYRRVKRDGRSEPHVPVSERVDI